ncbi:MAG: hypothetical protein LBJ83_02500 [Oscillospiraceae bacterium]|nr:hypothetical protein [Oscillospiraceae bacterium]
MDSTKKLIVATLVVVAVSVVFSGCWPFSNKKEEENAVQVSSSVAGADATEETPAAEAPATEDTSATTTDASTTTETKAEATTGTEEPKT